MGGLESSDQMDTLLLHSLRERNAADKNVLSNMCKLLEEDTFSTESINEGLFKEILILLRPNLSSAFSNTRLLSLKLITSLLKIHDIYDSLFFFQALFEAESVPADFQNFRERAALFRRLKYESVVRVPIKPLITTAILDVLFAQYYENFTPYWRLLPEIIESYAYNLPIDDFWESFMYSLTSATCAIERPFCYSDNDFENKAPDYYTFRTQMFKLLSNFSSLAERRSKTITPLLIALYKNEYMKVDTSHDSNKAENEFYDSPQSANDSVSGLIVESTSQNQPFELPQEEPKKIPIIKKRAITDTLKAILNVFSRFSNPKSVFREEEVRSIYYELLMSGDHELQKSSLHCLFCYKYNYLQQYREHLENLLNETKFRDELVLFSIDEQNSILADSHRPSLMPVLLRILYGCLRSHVIARGKPRRLAIYRFLSGCDSSELQMFLQLLLDCLQSIEVQSENQFHQYQLNYEAVLSLPLQKLIGVNNHISDILSYLCTAIDQNQRELMFHSIILSGIVVHYQSQKLAHIPARAFRSSRISIFKNLSKYFDVFSNQPISVECINNLFTHLLSPIIQACKERSSRKNDEKKCANIPVQLIELFCSWAHNSRYHPLLNYSLNCSNDNQIGENTPCETPIFLTCQALNNPETSSALSTKILNSIFTLLSDSNPNECSYNDDFGCLPQFVSDVNSAQKLGVAIVLPNLKDIMEYLLRVIQPNPKTLSQLPQVCFDVLDGITCHIDSPEMSEILMSTLVSYMNAPQLLRQEERVISVLNTISHLCVKIQKPLEILRKMSFLFSRLNGRRLRESLISIARSMRTTSLSNDSISCLKLLEELESWSTKQIQEPDADRRCIAYQKTEAIYDERSFCIPTELLQVLAHSHAYSIFTAKELSLRTLAANTFRKLISYCTYANQLNEEELHLHHLIHGNIVPLILRGLRLKSSETCRFAFVECLAVLVSSLPDHSQIGSLQQINKGVNANDDVDFFENIVHIQIHRRQRAIFRLTERLKSGELNIKFNVLLKFVVPIIEPYLMETASKLSAISDQSLKLFSAILAITPWTKYYQTLRSYMRQIDKEEKTKAAIRVIAAIFDAFHFDLNRFKRPKIVQQVRTRTRLNKSNKLTPKPNKATSKVKSLSLDANDAESKMCVDLDAKGENQKISRNIFQIVTQKILNQLHKSVYPQNYTSTHRKARHSDFENEEKLLTRALLIIAAAKLLKKLPNWVLKQNLDWLVLTIKCVLLSRSPAIRKNARALMEQLMSILGPKHLQFVIGELKLTMRKGYQIPVMSLTVFQLIASLEEQMCPGDIDPSLKDIIDVCKISAFGSEVLSNEYYEDSVPNNEHIKVPEEKINKTKDTFILIGRFIGPDSLSILLEALREIIEARPRSSTSKSLAEWLKSISFGLRSNSGIAPSESLQYARKMLSEQMPEMYSQQLQQIAKAKGISNCSISNGKYSKRPPSCLLLEPEPKRLGVIVKVAVKSKVSIFVEFAFQLIVDVFKLQMQRAQADSNFADQELLDSFVPLTIDGLKLKYDKIIHLSLRCLLYLFKYSNACIRKQITDVNERLFVILNDYSGHGSVNSNPMIVELQQLLFKCFTCVVRDTPEIVMGSSRIDLLLNYAQIDVLDSHKQATAFDLIKAMIGQKIENQKIDELIKYLAENAITSSSPSVCLQCRQTILLYLTVHPSGKKSILHWVEFFIDQLDYELESGRMSSLEMIHAILNAFVEEVNNQFALLLYVKLASKLVSDESNKCQAYIGLCIQKLVESITQSAFNDIFLSTRDWINVEKAPIRFTALKAFQHFFHSKATNFTEPKMMELLDTLMKENLFFNPTLSGENHCDNLELLASAELLVVFAQNQPKVLLRKILATNVNSKLQFSTLLKNLIVLLTWDEFKEIQCTVSQLIFTLLTIELTDWNKKLIKRIIELDDDVLVSLGIALAEQMNVKHGKMDCNNVYSATDYLQKQNDYVVKSLTAIMPSLQPNEFKNVCKILRKFGWQEAAMQRDDAIHRRIAIFKLMGALALLFQRDKTITQQKFDILCETFFSLLFREMSAKSGEGVLFQLSSEIGQIFNKVMGNNEYTTLLSRCQKERFTRLEQRKQEKKSRLISDPAAAALEKLKKNQKKSASRKRRIDRIKPYRVAKRRRTQQSENFIDE